MKKTLLVILLPFFAACASTVVVENQKTKSVPQHPMPAQPIVIPSGKALATIDPATLKVTYSKGVDPKQVVDELVKAWVQAVQGLNACRAELSTKK